MPNTDEAIGKAKTAIQHIFPDFASEDLRLEEIETPVEVSKWRVTFSTPLPDDPSITGIAELLRPRRIRKTVELHPDSLELVSIKAA